VGALKATETTRGQTDEIDEFLPSTRRMVAHFESSCVGLASLVQSRKKKKTAAGKTFMWGLQTALRLVLYEALWLIRSVSKSFNINALESRGHLNHLYPKGANPSSETMFHRED